MFTNCILACSLYDIEITKVAQPKTSLTFTLFHSRAYKFSDFKVSLHTALRQLVRVLLLHFNTTLTSGLPT